MELLGSKWTKLASVLGCSVAFLFLGCAARSRKESRTDLVFGPECKTVLRLRCERVDPPGECRIVSFKHVEGCEKIEVRKESK